MFKNFKVTILSLVLFSLLLFAVSCESSRYPVLALPDTIAKLTQPIAPKYFNLPEEDKKDFKLINESDENVTVYGNLYDKLPLASLRDTGLEVAVLCQAEDNGAELMSVLCRWINYITVTEIRPPGEEEMSFEEWLVCLDKYITFPDDSFDTSEYEERALKHVSEIYTGKLGLPAPEKLTLKPVSRIGATFNDEEGEETVNCLILEFEPEVTESGHTQFIYFVDPSGEEDKVLWMFADYVRQF